METVAQGSSGATAGTPAGSAAVAPAELAATAGTVDSCSAPVAMVVLARMEPTAPRGQTLGARELLVAMAAPVAMAWRAAMVARAVRSSATAGTAVWAVTAAMGEVVQTAPLPSSPAGVAEQVGTAVRRAMVEPVARLAWPGLCSTSPRGSQGTADREVTRALAVMAAMPRPATPPLPMAVPAAPAGALERPGSEEPGLRPASTVWVPTAAMAAPVELASRP